MGSILATLSKSPRKFEGHRNVWKRRDLRRAMVLSGGWDERRVQSIQDQKRLISHTPCRSPFGHHISRSL